MSRNNSYDLSGKTALVTGASRGIGAAIANALGDAGATVVAHYGSDHEGAQENLKGVPEERKVFIGSDLLINRRKERVTVEITYSFEMTGFYFSLIFIF